MYTHHNNFIEKHRVSCGHSTHTLEEVELVFFYDITAFLSISNPTDTDQKILNNFHNNLDYSFEFQSGLKRMPVVESKLILNCIRLQN